MSKIRELLMASARECSRLSRAFETSRARLALIAVALVLVLAGALPAAFAQDETPAQSGVANLIAGKRPVRSQGVRRASELTDGRAGYEGDDWNTHVTSVFTGRESFVVFDLGSERDIDAGWLQGDNNDSYTLEVSSDGESFNGAWLIGTHAQAGLRNRVKTGIGARGRYVKLSPRNGDGSFGVSEFQLFERAPSPLPPELPKRRGISFAQVFRDRTLSLGLFLLLPAVFVRRQSSPLWVVLGGLLALAGVIPFVSALYDASPIDSRSVALVRGVVGVTAALILAREVFVRGVLRAHPALTFGGLGLCSVLGVLCFYNLGQPQFYNRAADSWTFAHYLDLRQYYTTARYFPEIGYRGLYEADVAAFREDNPEGFERRGDRVPMRDLHSHDMSTIGRELPRIDKVKQQFSEERWEGYKKDASWFRSAMGEGHYLEMMVDYGGNATPVWMAIAHLIFSALDPSDVNFTLTGSLDLALLLGMFFAVFRCFGVRTMIVTMILFGANDFIMYGTNWGGATLRHDWLAYMGYGACALKREKWMLGGAMFGLAATIRAFPGLCLIGACLPFAVRLVERVWRERRMPPLAELYRSEQPTFRVVFGGALAIVLAVLFSMVVLEPAAWIDWYVKVSQLSAEPHPASIALRTLLGGSEGDQYRILASRRPVYLTAVFFFVGLVVIAARKRRLEQAAMLGMVLLPVVMYPANYYIHFVFLLPLIPVERKPATADEAPATAADAGVWLTLLAMCGVQYFTVLVPDLALHFYLETGVLFAMLTLVLFLLVWRDIPPFLEYLARRLSAAPAKEATPDASPAPAPTAESAPTSLSAGVHTQARLGGWNRKASGRQPGA
jgi:hypothetical protein